VSSALFQTGSTAQISECGTYRYELTRRWSPDGDSIAFVMLNPSTADADQDDPTIRRCIGFAKSWGYSGLLVYNIFALRSTDPKALQRHPDPIGPENNETLRGIAPHLEIVAAWGTWGWLNNRGRAVQKMLGDRLLCLGTTKQGHPKHPLYLAASTIRVPYRERMGRGLEVVDG